MDGCSHKRHSRDPTKAVASCFRNGQARNMEHRIPGPHRREGPANLGERSPLRMWEIHAWHGLARICNGEDPRRARACSSESCISIHFPVFVRYGMYVRAGVSWYRIQSDAVSHRADAVRSVPCLDPWCHVIHPAFPAVGVHHVKRHVMPCLLRA